jgi:hypothetical protein
MFLMSELHTPSPCPHEASKTPQTTHNIVMTKDTDIVEPSISFVGFVNMGTDPSESLELYDKWVPSYAKQVRQSESGWNYQLPEQASSCRDTFPSGMITS